MNGSSYPNYENRLVTTVPHLRASPRHGGARRFLAFFGLVEIIFFCEFVYSLQQLGG